MCQYHVKYECGHTRTQKTECRKRGRVSSFVKRLITQEECEEALERQRSKLCRACRSQMEDTGEPTRHKRHKHRDRGHKDRHKGHRGGSRHRRRHHHQGDERHRKKHHRQDDMSAKTKAHEHRGDHAHQKQDSHQEARHAPVSMPQASPIAIWANTVKPGQPDDRYTAKSRSRPSTSGTGTSKQRSGFSGSSNDGTNLTTPDASLCRGDNQITSKDTGKMATVTLQPAKPDWRFNGQPSGSDDADYLGARAAWRNGPATPDLCKTPLATFKNQAKPARPVSSVYSQGPGFPAGDYSAANESDFFTVYVDDDNEGAPPPATEEPEFLKPDVYVEARPGGRYGGLAPPSWANTTQHTPQSRFANLSGTTSEDVRQRESRLRAEKREEERRQAEWDKHATLRREQEQLRKWAEHDLAAQQAEYHDPNGKGKGRAYPVSDPCLTNEHSDQGSHKPQLGRSHTAREKYQDRWGPLLREYGTGPQPTPSTAGSQIWQNPRTAPRPPTAPAAPGRVIDDDAETTISMFYPREQPAPHQVNPRIVKEAWGSENSKSPGKRSKNIQQEKFERPSFAALKKTFVGKLGLRKKPSLESFACASARSHDDLHRQSSHKSSHKKKH